MAMTLEQVRDWFLARLNDGQMQRSVYTSDHQLREMADAIDVHLTQPAQAVDVGAIREVIAELRAGAEISRTSSSRTQTDKNVAGYLDRQADKLTRAISAAPPSNSPTTGAIGENGNG